MSDDVTESQQPNLHMYPMILTASCRRHRKLSIRGKLFSKCCKVTKTHGRVSTNPSLPPPLMYHGESISFYLRFEN